jgi:hypothetical protein
MKYSGVFLTCCLATACSTGHATVVAFASDSGTASGDEITSYLSGTHTIETTGYLFDTTVSKFNQKTNYSLYTFTGLNGADTITGSMNSNTGTEVKKSGSTISIRASISGASSLSGPDPLLPQSEQDEAFVSANQGVSFSVYSNTVIQLSWTSSLLLSGSPETLVEQLSLGSTTGGPSYSLLDRTATTLTGATAGDLSIALIPGRYEVFSRINYNFEAENFSNVGGSTKYDFGSAQGGIAFTITGSGATIGQTVTPGPASALTPALFGLATAWRRRSRSDRTV